MSGSQIEIQKQIGDDLQELNASLDLMKKSIEKKEIAENNSSTVSLIKEMLTNITTLDDEQDPKIKELLQNIDKEKKVTPQTIDAMVTKIIDIRLKILQDKTEIYTKETESKHQQVEKLISQKDSLNILLQSINKAPITPPTAPTQPKESRLKQNRKRLAAGGGLFAAIGLLKNNEDENGKSKGVFSRIWRGIKYGIFGAASAIGLKYLVGDEKLNKFYDRLGLAPAAPNVTADDTANTITGLTKDMEYSIDNGTTYKKYDGSVVPTFPGEQKVLVRTAKTDKKKESKTNEILFTADTTTPNTAPEQDNLTLDEHLKRNAAITKSIQDATAFPIAIDYGPDKANLEAKGCPTKIDFDASTQSIKFGTDQLKVQVSPFTTKIGPVDAEVNNVTVNSITFAQNAFVLNATGEGKLGFINKTDTMDVNVSKEQILQMLKPYYVEDKLSYSVSIPDKDNNMIPITITKVGGAPNVASSAPQTEYEKEFATLEQRKQTQYTEVSNNVIATYSGIVNFAGTNNLPPLIKNYDPSVNSYLQNPGAIGYMMDKSFATVGDIISDSFFDKVSNTANIGTDFVAEFLLKYKDNKYVGSILGTVGSWFQNLIGNNPSESDIKSKLANDPEGLKRVPVLIKQMAIVRFFITEKRNKLKQEYTKAGMQEPELTNTLEAKIDKVKIVGATSADASLYQTLKENNLLNTIITPETTTGVVINKKIVEVQKKIEQTAKKTNFQGERGDLKYDYATSTLTSRGKSTKLEISPDGKVKIQGLDINFSTVDEAVWFANATNRFTNKYYSLWEKTKGTVGAGEDFLYRSSSGLRHGIFAKKSMMDRVGSSGNLARNLLVPGSTIIANAVTDTQVLSESAIEDNYANRSGTLGEKYVAYLNKQIRSFGKPAVIDKVTGIFS